MHILSAPGRIVKWASWRLGVCATLLSRVSLTLPASKVHAHEPNSCSLSKTPFNDFKVTFSAKHRPSWSTAPLSRITLLPLKAEDLSWEAGPAAMEKQTLWGVPLLQWACPPGSLAGSQCAWLLFLSSSQTCLVGWLDSLGLTSVTLGRKPNYPIVSQLRCYCPRAGHTLLVLKPFGVCACTRSLFLSWVWLFVTPRTVTLQAPLPMGFPRQEYWSGLPFPSRPSRPRDWTHVSCISRWILYHWAPSEFVRSSNPSC